MCGRVLMVSRNEEVGKIPHFRTLSRSTSVTFSHPWLHGAIKAVKAFLSSTYVDLIEHRKLAVEALERLGQEVGRMELFGARPQEPLKACLSDIEACDIFIGIYAHRYGYTPSNSETSITEAEYNHAAEHKKPVFCFLVNEDYPWPPKMIEEQPAQSKLQHFKRRIAEASVVDDFTTPEVLAFKVASSVGRYLTKNIPPADSEVSKHSDVNEQIDRRLKLRVHQAQFVNNRVLYYFINATNLSANRTLEVTHVWYEDEENNHIPVLKDSRPLPVRLDIDQSWETWIAVSKIPEPNRFTAFENFRARISTGTVFKSGCFATTRISAKPIFLLPSQTSAR